jgi:Bacterial PH domain
MIYPAKRDVWISVLLMLVSLVQLSGALLLVGTFFWKHVPHLWVPGVILANVGGLLLWILLGTRYEIGEKYLVLRLGPLRWRLPLEAITEVYSTSRFHNDFGWGLALSMDRVRITFRNRWLPFWISPENKTDFIAELKRANPHVQVVQD